MPRKENKMAEPAVWHAWIQTGQTEFSNLFIWEDGKEIVAEVELIHLGNTEQRVARFQSKTEAREWCERTALELEASR